MDRLPIESVKNFDSGTENFIAEFLHDGERSEGEERTHCKVTSREGDGEVQVILQIDEKPVATHVLESPGLSTYMGSNWSGLAVSRPAIGRIGAAISPTLSASCRPWLNGKEKELRVQPEVSHDGAQPLGIDVRVARRLNTLMA